MTQAAEKPYLQWARLGRSVLNGVIGDYLEQSNNPLAISMNFYHRSEPLTLDATLPEQIDVPLSGKVVVFLHGLTNLESIWNFENKITAKSGRECANYGELLHEKFGFTPLFLRYNTGRSIAANGHNFAHLLARLHENYPVQIDALMLVGFSMGGLVSRHAQYAAQKSNLPWLQSLSHCMYLGTPHEGAPLEKFGDLVGRTFAHLPKEYLHLWAEWVAMRSEGIKELKLGLKDRNSDLRTTQHHVGFHPQAQHYFIGGGLSKDQTGMLSYLLGDGLVRAPSAMPASAPPRSESMVFDSMPHLRLSHSEQVYSQMSAWLRSRIDKAQITARLRSKNIKTAQHQTLTTRADEHENAAQMMTGTMALAIHAFGRIVDTTERMHRSIAAEPFSVLSKIPAVNQASKPVEVTHERVSTFVYTSLKTSGRWSKKLLNRFSKNVAETESDT